MREALLVQNRDDDARAPLLLRFADHRVLTSFDRRRAARAGAARVAEVARSHADEHARARLHRFEQPRVGRRACGRRAHREGGRPRLVDECLNPEHPQAVLEAPRTLARRAALVRQQDLVPRRARRAASGELWCKLRHLCVERGAREVDEGREHARRPQRLRRLGAAAAGARERRIHPAAAAAGHAAAAVGAAAAAAAARAVASIEHGEGGGEHVEGDRDHLRCAPRRYRLHPLVDDARRHRRLGARPARARRFDHEQRGLHRTLVDRRAEVATILVEPAVAAAGALVDSAHEDADAGARGGRAAREEAEGGGSVEVGLGDVDRIFDAARENFGRAATVGAADCRRARAEQLGCRGVHRILRLLVGVLVGRAAHPEGTESSVDGEAVAVDG